MEVPGHGLPRLARLLVAGGWGGGVQDGHRHLGCVWLPQGYGDFCVHFRRCSLAGGWGGEALGPHLEDRPVVEERRVPVD